MYAAMRLAKYATLNVTPASTTLPMPSLKIRENPSYKETPTFYACSFNLAILPLILPRDFPTRMQMAHLENLNIFVPT